MIPVLVAAVGFSMMYGALKAEEWAETASRDEFTSRPESMPFSKMVEENVNKFKGRLANPFGPYDRMDFVAGSVVLGVTYFAQAAMILWGPPPLKAVGIAWVTVPMGDPFVFSMGVKYNPF